jgi:toxin secretion/phage lysis holin
MQNKNIFSAFIGLVGAAITTLLGGWSAGLTTLLIFMIIDYISGLLVAGVFKASNKSETGALNSKAGWKGLAKKSMTLFFVLIAYRLDLMIGTNYIRDAVVIGFCVNELISIVENAATMGLPLPPVLIKAIDILVSKEDK